MLVEVFLFVVLVFLLLQILRKPPGLPPGRWGLPLVGYIPFTTMSVEEQIKDLHRRHGDIYLWRIGTQVMVFLHDHHLVREAFNRTEFTHRPPWETYKFLEDPPLGVVASNNVRWHSNRRFSLRQLRDLGMGKSKLVDAVQQQAVMVKDELVKQAGTPAPIPNELRIAITNVVWQLVGGKQFLSNDATILNFINILNELMSIFDRFAIPDFLPWVSRLLPTFLYNRLTCMDTVEETKRKLLAFFAEEIKHHKDTLDPDNPRDLIDGYLLEMQDKKDDPESICSERDLEILVLDLFIAGSETTTSTLTSLIYYLATFPHVQRKLQAEIDEVLPKGTLATLEDKPRLPYTEAVIHETMRISTLVPFSLQHVASQDTKLGGYDIPKGTILNGTTFSIHRDPRYWDRPDEFLPERWLNEEGKFNTKKEGMMPFGLGKRQCLGESLARMELLIFTTTILQSVSFAPPPGKTLDLRPQPGNFLLHLPRRQDILVTARNL